VSALQAVNLLEGAISLGVLARIQTPDDLRQLDPEEMKELAAEIREFLVQKVSATGGHLDSRGRSDDSPSGRDADDRPRLIGSAA